MGIIAVCLEIYAYIIFQQVILKWYLSNYEFNCTFRSEHACKPCKILQWLSGLCHSTFGSEKYVLGPACPLQDSCNVVSKNSTDIHILDLSRGEHVKCGEARIDNHKHVRIWASDNNVSKHETVTMVMFLTFV